MNLNSCDSCGVVVDLDKIEFPSEIYDDVTDSIDHSKADWSERRRDYVPFVPCPVCKARLRKE